MSRNLRARIERLERRRLKAPSTPRTVSFFDFAAAVFQGRQDEADALWVQLPEETRAQVEAAMAADPDELEKRINAPLRVTGTE